MRVFVMCLALSLFASANAQQIIPVYQESHHKFVFSDPAFKVLEVLIPKGEETLDHSHQLDVATVCIECADSKIREPGKPWGPRRVRQVGGFNVTEYVGRPGAHAIQNVGTGNFRLIGVENQHTSGWSTAEPLDSQPGITLGLETRSFRIYDVRIEPGAASAKHVHTVPAVVVLDTGDVAASDENARASRRLTKAGEWIVVPAGTGHTLNVQGSRAAHLVEIEVR
ncbi:MAG: hypothetical protein ABL964_03930 [Steroidobacteraceae bacterium]